MNEFTKSLCKIAIPVTVQCMLQSSFSIVDQLMIGQLGKEAVSAVGLCGNFSLIYSVVMGAVGSVAGILIAQFLGAKDDKEAWRSFTVSGLVGIIISAFFMLAAFGWSSKILGLYTNDKLIIKEGTAYLRVIGLAFILMGINTIISTWLRCREHASIPLVASFLSVIVNTLLNYILIFGKFGFQSYEINGAAYATVISQFVNLLIILLGFIVSLKKDKDYIQLSLHLEKVSFSDYIIMITPILVSEFLWSLGQNVESAVYGHLSTESLAAYTLTCPIQGLFCGALSGLSAAAGVMIGKRLGAKEFDGAFKDAKKIMWVGLVGSVIGAIMLISLSGTYVSLYQMESSILNLGRIVLIVFSLYAPFKVENMILGGIIKSGGDTMTIMIIDIIGTWIIGIPLCLFAAYVLKWQIVGVYTLLTVEEVFRLLTSLVIFQRKNWIKTLA